MLALSAAILVLAPAAVDASAPAVIPFRTEAAPRVDPVFGDVAALREAIDQFLSLQGEMERVRDEFSTAVHQTMTQLAPIGARPAKSCPPTIPPAYARALEAGRRFLALGRRLEGRFREIRRSDDLGDAVGLTPDYRWKARKARELYLTLLRDYREMRVAFHDQLGAELRHAGCRTGAEPTAARPAIGAGAAGATRAPAAGAAGASAPPDPVNLADWELDPADGLREAATAAKEGGGARAGKAGSEAGGGAGAGAGPAIWIEIDNSRCDRPSTLTLDGIPVGAIAAQKKVSVRTRAGPHELCVLPVAEKRACGAAGTVRRAYLYEGWTLAVRCEK
jgi:hypothetical protein